MDRSLYQRQEIRNKPEHKGQRTCGRQEYLKTSKILTIKTVVALNATGVKSKKASIVAAA